jgi:secreted protein with Ig-like and vWFA domain
MEINLIGKSSIKLLLNYTITVAVAYNSNPGSLDNLEKLILQILAVIPSGYVVGQIERPTVTSVGASNLLAADINVSTYYTQTN